MSQATPCEAVWESRIPAHIRSEKSRQLPVDPRAFRAGLGANHFLKPWTPRACFSTPSSTWAPRWRPCAKHYVQALDELMRSDLPGKKPGNDL